MDCFWSGLDEEIARRMPLAGSRWTLPNYINLARSHSGSRLLAASPESSPIRVIQYKSGPPAVRQSCPPAARHSSPPSSPSAQPQSSLSAATDSSMPPSAALPSPPFAGKSLPSAGKIHTAVRGPHKPTAVRGQSRPAGSEYGKPACS